MGDEEVRIEEGSEGADVLERGRGTDDRVHEQAHGLHDLRRNVGERDHDLRENLEIASV